MDSITHAEANVADDLFAEGCLTVEQAVVVTTMSRSSLYAAMGAGELAFVRRGRRRLIPRRALTEWLAEGLVGASRNCPAP